MMKLRIITHNIMYLQGVPKLTSKEGSVKKDSLKHNSLRSDIIRILVDFYQSLKPQIICLQEVSSIEDARKIAGPVKMKVYYESGKSNPKYGGAILIDSSYASRRLSFSNSGKETFERGCLMVEVSNEDLSLSVFSLHLPSNVRRTPEEGNCVRLKELASALSFSPAIIAGDLNQRPDQPVYQKLRKAGYLDAASILGKERIPTCNKARIDYVWIHKDADLRLEEYAVCEPPAILGLLAGKIKGVSDHLPLIVTFICAKRT